MSLADYCYETTNHARSYTYTYLGPDRLEYSIILKIIGKKSIIYNLLSLNIYKKVLPTIQANNRQQNPLGIFRNMVIDFKRLEKNNTYTKN